MRLIKPSVNLKEQYIDYFIEWELVGEKMKPGILRKMNPNYFEEMMKALQEIEFPHNVQKGTVPESVYWLVDEKKRILGAVTIRHSLTEPMLNTEGHIGAGIRPTERRNGYGEKLLELTLDKMQKMGFEKALVTCNEDNIGSEKAIIKNGGIKDTDFLEAHGNIVKRYWITL